MPHYLPILYSFFATTPASVTSEVGLHGRGCRGAGAGRGLGVKGGVSVGSAIHRNFESLTWVKLAVVVYLAKPGCPFAFSGHIQRLVSCERSRLFFDVTVF